MTQQNLSSNFKPLAGPSGPSAAGPSQMLQGGAQSTTASTGAGHFLSGKSIKNRKMGAGGAAGASGQGPAGASGATNIAGKRRASINNHRQQQQFFANQQPGQFVNFEQMQQQLEGGLTLGGVDLVANQQQAMKQLIDPKDKSSSLHRVYQRALNMESEEDPHQLLRIQQSASSSGAVASPTQQIQQQQIMNMHQ